MKLMLKPSADLSEENHVSGETCIHPLPALSNKRLPVQISQLKLFVYLYGIFIDK